MRVFWWQGGLHAEPETDEERSALMTLWDGIKKGKPAEMEAPGFTGEGETTRH